MSYLKRGSVHLACGQPAHKMGDKREKAMPEIRWYKGKYRVEVLQKSKGNYLVKALEPVPFKNWLIKGYPGFVAEGTAQVNDEFTTVPRLLWRKPRK